MRYIFDLDGTLADCTHRLHLLDRRPKEWDAFFKACDQDHPIFPMIQLLGEVSRSANWIEIWSGRSEAVRAETLEWLSDVASCTVGEYGGYHVVCRLRMRAIGDYTQDHDLKRDWLYADKLAGGDRIDLVFEDRQRVVDMWRSEGIMCCQVAPGQF